LQEFAFDHFLGEIDEDIEDVEIALFEGNLERLHVEPIAGEDAAMIAPAGVGGGTAAASVGAVNHIVVDESGTVEEFDDGSETNGATRIGGAAAGITVAEKEQRGTEAFAAATEKITGDF
jgi:hypothetical protein